MAKPDAIRPVGARHKLNLLVYAEPGAGKTPFIGTSERALVLDADGAETSLALHKSNADVWTMSDHNDTTEALDYLTHEKNNGGYKWVWLDGITLFQERGLRHVMDDLVAIPKFRHRDRDLPDRGEYKLNYGRIMRWVADMAALPINFGITAHVHFDEDNDMHVPLIAGRSASSGPMWMKVCGHMGVVGYLRRAKTKESGEHWVLQCDNWKNNDGDVYYGKTWFEGMKMLRKPTIPKIDAIVADALGTKARTKGVSKKTVARKRTAKKPTARRRSR